MRCIFLFLFFVLPLAASPDGEALFRLGQSHYAAGRYDEAALQFKRLIQEYDSSRIRPESVYWLGLSLLAQGQADSADAVLATLTEQDPAIFISAQIGLSIIALGKKDWKRAEACLEKALYFGDNTLRSTAYYLMYRSKKEEGEARKSNAYCLKLITEFPYSLEAEQVKKEYGGAFPKLPVEEEHVKSARNAAEKGYTLQVGAFSIPENAEKMRDKLKMTHTDVSVSEVKKGGNTFYAVRIGSFENEKKALFFAQETLKILPDAFQVKKKGE